MTASPGDVTELLARLQAAQYGSLKERSRVNNSGAMKQNEDCH